MVIHETLFEIAIYRIDPERWSRDATARIKTYKDKYLDSATRNGIVIDAWTEDHAEKLSRFAERPFDWDYNEVMGWLKIIWDGPGPLLKGYVWQVGHASFDGTLKVRHRYQRGFKPHPFVGGDPYFKAIEVWFDARQSNEEIFDELREGIMHIVGPNGDFPKRHLDLRAFDNVGPFLDWRTLVNGQFQVPAGGQQKSPPLGCELLVL
jgi:hypothetical protein